MIIPMFPQIYRHALRASDFLVLSPQQVATQVRGCVKNCVDTAPKFSDNYQPVIAATLGFLTLRVAYIMAARAMKSNRLPKRRAYVLTSIMKQPP